MPFLLMISSFFLNYKFNSSNEILILKQYFSIKNNIQLSLILTLIIAIFYTLNNEYLSVNLYHKYKIKELDIRNNLKLGVPSLNEFHIQDEVSIFFDVQKNNKFFNVESIIYNDGQFIKSNKVEIEIEKKNYNLIFYNGERVILNKEEKSKTSFDKFIYSIENDDIDILMFDKEHFNTLELLKHQDSEFYFQGHNRLYQYLLTLVVIIISFKIIFFHKPKKNNFIYYLYLFLSLLIIQVINSYLLFLLNENTNLLVIHYYFINIFVLLVFCYFIFKFNENN